MDTADALLGGLAGGDADVKISNEPGLKREHDSVDDFEHLDQEGTKRDEFSDSPIHHGARVSTQSFLDTEREELFVEPARAPAPAPPSQHFADKLIDHIADKFTDSESDDTAGESPIHRPEPPLPPLVEVPHPSAPTPEPVASAGDPTPILAPTPAPEPKPVPVPVPPIQPAPKLEPVPPPPKSEPKLALKSEPPPAPTQVTRALSAHVIEAEVIFCQMGLDAWFDPQRLHPKVESLIYWRDPARSGAALGAGLVLLIALACCSVVSVLAYASLLALSAAVAFRIYRNVLQAVQKTNEGHPFKWMLEKDISVPAERAQSLAAAATAHLNATANELRRLFLVEDLVDSLKFGVLLWCLTYVGACFNGITLIILGWIALFTLPKAYEMNKAQVDANLELARGKINEISAKVRAAVPLGRKSETEKDK